MAPEDSDGDGFEVMAPVALVLFLWWLCRPFI